MIKHMGQNSRMSLIAVFIFIATIFAGNVYGQTGPTLESCFQYYDYGKITAQLASEHISYSSGEKIKLKGSIINNNTFPLVNLTLYALVRRINDETYIKNGHYLVDNLTLKEGMSFLPGEKKVIEVEVPVKATYPSGNYQIQYFILSPQGFHYGGRPFLEEDFAGSSNFTVNGVTNPEVFFDINTFKANGKEINLRDLIQEFPLGPIKFETNIIDNRATQEPLQVEVKFYYFEATFKDKFVGKDQLLTSNGGKKIAVDFTPPTTGAYVMVLEMLSPQQSVFKFRFAAAGEKAPDLRMNDLGVSNYPATESDRAWVCFHSPAYQNAPRTEVTLLLLDSNKKVVDQTSVTDSFDGQVRAISVPLAKLKTQNDFSIKALFTQQELGERVRDVEIHYSCDIFTASLKSINLSYNAGKNVLLIKQYSTCGTLLKKNLRVDAVRIKQGDTVQKEFFGQENESGEISLAGLPPGAYKADVKIGTLIKSLDFTIPTAPIQEETPAQNMSQASRNFSDYLFPIVAMIILVSLLYFLVRKK